jgi:co-chaperonin GroES (HSP10)
MTSTIENFKPLRDDVLLIRRPEEQKGVIFVKDTADSDTHHHYIILKAGEQCKYVKEGDIVVGDWRKITQPFDLRDENGKIVKVAITSEKELSAIIEE